MTKSCIKIEMLSSWRPKIIKKNKKKYQKKSKI